MIRRLKQRFILLAALATVLLMAVLVGGMNLINYRSVAAEADEVLDMLPHFERFGFGLLTGPGGLPAGAGSPSGQPGSAESPEDGQPPALPAGMSPEVPYESRYFSLLVTPDGELLETDTSRIISVEKEELEDYALRALQAGPDRGFLRQFRYVRQSEAEGIRIYFLDCGRRLDAFRSFFMTSALIGLLGCVLAVVLVALAAGRILRPVAESYEKQRRFITDAGHEIKTPLTIIAANVDLLEADPAETECLQDIRQQTERLSGLTRDLVFLSKMEEPETGVKRLSFSLSELAAEAAAAFQGPARARHLLLQTGIEPELVYTGAPEQLERLLYLLLDNTIKYTPEGGTIELTLAAGRRELLLSLSNTTREPIPREELSRLFDRFYRRDASRSSETGGHGIGLSVARAIVSAHGGTIEARSNGCLFSVTVTLPRA